MGPPSSGKDRYRYLSAEALAERPCRFIVAFLSPSWTPRIQGVTLHAFESKSPFGKETLKRVRQLKTVYGMDYGAVSSHRLREGCSSRGE